MDRTSAANWTDIGGGKRGYRDRNLGAGIAGTALVAADRNAIQEELVGLIEAAGLTPAAGNLAQVKAALDILYGGGGTLAPFGWQRLPRGLILQWGGGGSVTGSADEINFPVAFTTARYALNINEANAAGWASNNPTILGVSPGPTPLTSFRIYTLTWTGSGWGPSGGVGFSWMAVGR